MIFSFIKIRITQICRILAGIGIFRSLILLILILVGVLFVFNQTSKAPNVYVISLIYLFSIYQLHTKRKDHIFLKSQFHNYKLIYLSEYFTISLPLIITLTINTQWLSLVMTFGALLFIANLNFSLRQRTLNTKIQKWIPKDCFEWKAGIRTLFFFLITVWIGGLLISPLIWGTPLALLIIGLIPLAFYDKNEPIQILLASELCTRRFLFHKIKLQIILFSFIAIPLILMFISFHLEKWYIILIEYILLISFQIYIIFAKYTFYEPNTESPAAKICHALGTIGIIIPILIPVIWLFTIVFYFKSAKKLNFYLNDYN